MTLYCPQCKDVLEYIEPPEDTNEEYNENYICKGCKTKWLIVYGG